MNEGQWSQVDSYFTDLLVRPDATLAATLEASDAAGLPPISVADNVVRHGAVIDGHSRDANVIGVRRFMELVSLEPRVSATAIQTVGSKGYDGFAMAVVID